MSSSMRNKKRQHTAVLAQVAAQHPESIERRANERADGLEKVIADLEHSLRRCGERAEAYRKDAQRDLAERQRRISELSRTVRKQRNDILILIGGYVALVGVYVYSII